MVKKILFIQNRKDVKRSNFFDHWENIHAPHMVKVLKPQKYVLTCLLYTSPSPRDNKASRMPSSA